MYLVTRILKWIDMKMNEHCYNKIIKAMFWVFLSVGFSTVHGDVQLSKMKDRQRQGL